MSGNQNIDVERLPEDGEVFGIVTNMLGANRVTVRCLDGEERTCRIPGRMQKKVWIREDDLVIAEPWEWQDEKGDVVHRYEKQEADEIKNSDMVELSDDE
jgi:translation initiation factor 1A